MKQGFVSCILFVASSPAMAQLCFQETEIITTLFEPTEVVFSDVDQDGDMDFISTSSPTPSMQPGASGFKIAWYENDGAGVPAFTEHLFGDPSGLLYDLQVFDFNGDGYPDIFAYTESFGPYVWFQNTGGPNPAFIQRELVLGGTEQPLFEDFDSDGDIDLVFGAGIFLYTGVGSSHFEIDNTFYDFIGTISGMADIDGDGDLDVLTNSGSWYESDGSATPNFTEHFISANAIGQTLRPIELVDAGTPDLLSSTDTVFLNVNGTFSEVTIPNAVGPLIPADIDTDGDLDFVDVFGVWHENIASGLVYETHPIDNSLLGLLTVRDFDGDGDLDVADPSQSVWYRNEIIPHGGSPVFDEQTFVGLSPDSTPSMNNDRLIDIDGDGDLDSFINREEDGLFTWFANSTVINTRTNALYGDLGAAVDASIDGDTLIGDSGIFECAAGFLPFGRTNFIKSTGDLYLLDMVNLSSGSYEAAEGFDLILSDLMIRQFMGAGAFIEPFVSGQEIRVNSLTSDPQTSFNMNGDVVFAPKASVFPYISSPTPIAKQIQSGDLDNDGDVDTITLGDDGSLSWFAQQSQTPWSPWDGGQLSIPSALSESFEVGDFNNDGLLDIAAQDEGELFLFFNNGFNNGLEPFTLQTIVTGDFSQGDIEVGDFDNDGDLDIIYGGLGSGGYTARLFTNNGASPPAFSSSVVYLSALPINHLNLVDLEGDGDLDVLIAFGPPIEGESGVVVLTNQGTSPATFSGAQQGFFWQGTPRKVYGGDFDGDGDADILAILSGAPERLMLLENQYPSPEFRRRVLDQEEEYGTDLAVGDFDSDGDLDFMAGTLVYYENTGKSSAYFRKNDMYADGNGGAIHPIDYQQNGALDIVRSGMQWSRNLDFTHMQFYGSVDIFGDLEIIRSKVYMPDTSMGPTFFNVSGVMKINAFSEVFASVNTFEISTLVNAGSLTFTNLTQIESIFEITGSYAQYDVTPSGETSGSLRMDLFPNGMSRLAVQGTAALAGSLIVNEFSSFDVPISGEESLGVILEASSFVPGRDRFDVYSGPILTLEYSDGSTAIGTVIPMYNQSEGPTSTLTLVPITLDELLFTQNPFSSEGIPNDAVLADVTGAPDGSPDGDVDLIVAIPEIPGISPNGAVAVFQGSLNVNGFQMVSASLFTGAIVDSPGSVEVGYFDNDSIPDIAFANQGTNGNNNDVHFLHMDSSNPTPLSIAPLPAFDIGVGLTVSDLATDNFVAAGEGTDDLLMGVQSNGSGGGSVQALAFGLMDWESCEVDVDDVDTVTAGRSTAVTRGLAFADVVVTSPDSNTATYFVNIGDFENMVPIVIPTGTRPTEVLAEDLNGDGEPEVVVICEGNDGNQGVVTVSRNLGGNIFAPPVNLPLGTNEMINPNPVSLALSDVDDDGDRDMVLVSVNDSGDQTVRVIRNTTVLGNGLSFASVIDAPNQPAGLPLIVRSADLDGDSPGIPDDIIVLINPQLNLTINGGNSNSVDLSGEFCAADLSRDGVLNFFDISAFLIAFTSEDSAADFSGDGLFNFFDVSAFLQVFSAGCP